MESRIAANLFGLSPMKTIPPTCPEPETGRKYWRSLDQLAGTPEFRQWMEREFPNGASEWSDPVSRRHFVKIMSASFLLAGLGLAGSGCRRPVEKIEPFGKAPENNPYVFGMPQFYATAMPTRTGAIPLVVKSYEGRPTKIEGNSLYPGGNGGTDRFAQASILNLYDPDRAQYFTKGGKPVAPEEALSFLDELSKKFAANGGDGLAFLAEPSTSPSRARLQNLIAQKFPKSQWFTYDPIDAGIHQRAATQAFGQPVRPVFHYDKAKVILSLDCDFLGTEEDVHNNIRQFVQGRKIEKPGDSMNRLYVVEALMTLTGTNADHRLRVPANAIFQIAKAFVAKVASKSRDNSLAGLSATYDFELISKYLDLEANQKWIEECANDLIAAGKNALVVAGQRQPIAVHFLAYAINSALGAIGNTVTLIPATETAGADLKNLFAPDTLIILGGNPAYDSSILDSADLFVRRKGSPTTVVRFGYYEDETSERSSWHFPAAHYLESWGDAITDDGALLPIQPLIQPLFGGLTELEFLARIAGESQTNPYDIVRATRNLGNGIEWGIGSLKAEEFWKKFLFNGFWSGPTRDSVQAKFLSSDENQKILFEQAFHQQLQPGRNLNGVQLEVIFYRDAKVDDGRYTNNGWLQELPDPITKLTWDNAVLISRKTAKELGVANYDVVRVTLNGRSVEGPVWIQPGMADYSIGLALGYGREKAGRVGSGVGFNAYKIFTGKFIETGAKIEKTGRTYQLSCTQNHWSMEGRPIVREANLDQFREHPAFAKGMHAEEPEFGGKKIVEPLYPNPFDEVKATGQHQWGMSIDLNSCVGCEACMVACQSENNIPIVGKDQVNRGREMHWIRIDRYYAGDPAKERDKPFAEMSQQGKQPVEEAIDDPQVVTQPMLCQHCEAAPCENVCPVNATVHDQEGLNLMVYNRCVGTRYCSNNCPYKVRRFNYLDYNKRTLEELKGPFYPTPLKPNRLLHWWKDPTSPTTGMRKADDWDLIKMLKNPDVTVRMRGVMEKCTFCVQRIQQAKIAQKIKAGASGEDVIVPDGTFTTACAQACPAGAIVFGNIADPESRVSKLKRQERDYTVLDFLLTKPRLTYLARIRNPNPAMPDYRKWPLSFEEFEKKNGSPFESEKAAGKGDR
jgi:MoCo/4Fe-4S cofactor protein with predicted Tat translocation signal